jgi:high-affinity iron transporter
MFATALIIFREVFEIVLIVGIILAATKMLPNRLLWIALGAIAGLIGSGSVAYFTDSIAELSEGMGQEVFNAGILFIAALFIGWTVIWMKQHAKEMKAHFTNVGHSIAQGTLPYYSLSIVIALAMLREGSEIVLFTYGQIASGVTMTNIINGSLIGLTGGLIVGLSVYFGLLKLSMKHFFNITSWLLILLVAGMISQAIGYLSSAGYFNEWSRTVWDSSWLMSEDGILGQTIGVLMGYTARPSIIQLICYSAVLLFFVFIMKNNQKVTIEHKSVRTA